MEHVRIGCVKYLNTLPLIEGLEAWRSSGGCELIASAPSGLIGMLRRGEVDVALASVIDAAKPGAVLLPVGMIGCEGRTLTVRVFSRVPIERITRVVGDADSHTSVALLQVLMWKKHGKRVEIAVREMQERARSAQNCADAVSPSSFRTGADEEAVLLIGDKVVTDAPLEVEYPHQMDLGAAWKELTGLPFVYAVWMCRAGEEESLKTRAAAMMLERARLHNATRMDWVVGTYAEERGWSRELAAEYVGTLLKYEVGEAERQAVEKFVGWAGELGICGSDGVKWADMVGK